MTWSAHVHEHRCGTHEGRRDRNPQLDVQVAQVGKWASQGVQGATSLGHGAWQEAKAALTKVYEPEPAHPRAQQHVRSVAAHPLQQRHRRWASVGVSVRVLNCAVTQGGLSRRDANLKPQSAFLGFAGAGRQAPVHDAPRAQPR